MAETKIAFVRMAPHPIPNRLLPGPLAAAFGGASIEIVDVEAAVRRDPVAMLVNPAFVALEHGRNLLRRRVSPWQAFFTTTWMFRRMSQIARRRVERGGFDFSFQIQSLFDARSPGTPHFVYTDHTHLANLAYPDFDRRTLRGSRWLALERALYTDSAAVFTRSGNISQSVVADYGVAEPRVVCVGAGSNAQIPSLDTTRRERLGKDVLFVGVDWDRKGGPELLEAFRRVAPRHPEARLTVVGCAPEVSDANVRIVGRVPVEEVHRYYEEASIFCMPSRREPFGVAYVEAQHHGLPVVATRIGAIPDLVDDGENGYLVDVGDVDALSARLEELLADGSRRQRLGDRARRRAKEMYTWEAVAERMAGAIRARVDRRDEVASGVGSDTAVGCAWPERGTA